MDSFFSMRPPDMDPAVWRPSIPLVVLERCESAQMITVWLAIRWLMAAFPHRRGFNAKEIARRARVNRKYVRTLVGEDDKEKKGWVNQLVDLGLLAIVGEEEVPGLPARPIYAIPLRELEQASAAMALEVLMAWGVKEPPPPPPPGQTRFDLEGLTGDNCHQLDPTDPKRDQLAGDNCRTGGVHVSKYVSKGVSKEDAPPHESETEPEDHPSPSSALPPPPPPDEYDLSAHPLVLWQAARAKVRPMDEHQLRLLATEHDGPTNGHGLYWLGRAILAADFTDRFVDNPKALRVVKTILRRWRDGQCYGHDLEPSKKDQRYGSRSERRADANQQRPDAAGAGPPAGLKLARVADSEAAATTDSADGQQ